MGVGAGPWYIDDTLTFTVVTHRFDTGAATDADSVPTYRVYEDETTTPILTGSTALLDSANTAGFYSEQITLSAANGFEAGKSYSIYVAATVNSVAAVQSLNFKVTQNVWTIVNDITNIVENIEAVTDQFVFTVANKVNANATAINGDATSAANLAKTTNAIARATVGAASSTTSIVTSAFTPAGAVLNQFVGRIVTFDADTTTTALRGQSTDITGSSNAATPTLTVTALTTAPASGDTFSVT